MAKKQKPEDQGYEYGQVLPLRQRPIPYAGALRPELAMPQMAQSLANSLGGMLTIPGRVERGEIEPSPEAALQFTEGMMNAGLGGSSLTGVPRGAMGNFAGARSAESALPAGLPMKAGQPVMPEGWIPPTRPEAAAPISRGDSALGQMEARKRAPSNLSPEGAREVSTLEREAEAGIAGKMASGDWKGLPKRLPDWIKSDSDFQLYQRELQEHSQNTNSMMRSLGIEAANKGHKLLPVESVPKFLSEGGV